MKFRVVCHLDLFHFKFKLPIKTLELQLPVKALTELCHVRFTVTEPPAGEPERYRTGTNLSTPYNLVAVSGRRLVDTLSASPYYHAANVPFASSSRLTP